MCCHYEPTYDTDTNLTQKHGSHMTSSVRLDVTISKSPPRQATIIHVCQLFKWQTTWVEVSEIEVANIIFTASPTRNSRSNWDFFFSRNENQLAYNTYLLFCFAENEKSCKNGRSQFLLQLTQSISFRTSAREIRQFRVSPFRHSLIFHPNDFSCFS